ncbi:MAG: c-type cytochrome [Polyangiaceae bacterium]|jgi:mono/diheme cytochrome c family protein
MRASLLFTSVLALGMLAGCRGQTSKDSPIVGIRGMYDQPRYDMQSKSAFFADKRTMRSPVEGTISREEIWDAEIGEGRLRDDSGYVLAVPAPVVEHMGGAQALIARGQERFTIYCTPCHDGTGSGHGMAVKHGMLAPPTFHQDRIRHMPDGQMFATISNGIRNMPSYGISIPVTDRWAIVAYVRALQLSQAPIASSKEHEL